MSNSKPAVKSISIWGGFISLLPLVYQHLPEVIAQVAPVLSPQIGAVVSAIGGIIAIFGRVKSSGKKIDGMI